MSGNETEPETPPEATSEAPGVSVVEEDPSAALRQELDEVTGRLKAVSAAYKAQQEEMHLFKERLERQASMREERMKGDAVNRLFEPLDNLGRSIEALRAAGVDAQLIEGMELVQKGFMEGFTALGLEEVGRVGESFRPDLHEALTQIPCPKEQDGKVVQVFSKGYRVGSRVIRAARVIVGAWTAPEGEA